MKIEKHKCPVCLEFVDMEILGQMDHRPTPPPGVHTIIGQPKFAKGVQHMRPTKHLDCLGRRCPKRGPRGIYPVPGSY